MRAGAVVGALALGGGWTGCAVEGDDSQCTGKCDTDGTGWKAQLDGMDDPIATWLRASEIDDDGMIDATYGRVLNEIAAQQGCDEASISTFVVSDSLISEAEPFPRLVSTVCTNDDAKASDFYIAASFREPGTDDVDVRSLEMFAWDETNRVYRFYETIVVNDEVVEVHVDPERCRDCHLGPATLDGTRMAMLPIMNELTAPWTHWNAEPDFPSHDYDIPAATEQSPHFVDLGAKHLGAAPRLEQIVRAGHAKVAGARARQRRTRPPSLTESMSLLRPVFCDEQINYASEDFNSGLISATSVISGGIREAYLATSASDWPWNWLTDGRMRLPVDGSEALHMVPVRGNADIDYEGRLMAVQTLTPHQILRVRALDWKRPVLSDFRCKLWKDAATRLEANPPALDESWRNSDAMAMLYDEIMKLDGVPIVGGTPDDLVVVDRITSESEVALFLALGDGSIGSAQCSGNAGMCSVPIEQFGSMLHDYVTSFEDSSTGRASIAAARDNTLCDVLVLFENAPALPPLPCE